MMSDVRQDEHRSDGSDVKMADFLLMLICFFVLSSFWFQSSFCNWHHIIY